MLEITDLHQPFIKWLKAERIPYLNPRSDRESTIAEGHPDFTLLMGNRSLFLEFKTEKGKLRPEQVKRIAELERAGNTVHVVRDVGVAIELAIEWRRQIGTTYTAPPPAAEPGCELVIFGSQVMRLTGMTMDAVRLATDEDKLTLRKVG